MRPLALASRLSHQLRQSIRTARRLFMFKDLSRRHFLAGSTAAAGALTLGGPAAFAADPLKVGYIYVGPVGDFGWTHGHDVARRAVEDHFGAKVKTSYVESDADRKSVVSGKGVSVREDVGGGRI